MNKKIISRRTLCILTASALAGFYHGLTHAADPETVPVIAPMQSNSPVPVPAAAAQAPAGEQPLPALSPQEQQNADALVQSVKERALANADKAPAPIDDKNALRVNHVPEFIKNEIREQVRAELRADVVQDVLAQAKNEQWGMPQALPGWVNHFSLKGDMRLRVQVDSFASDNQAQQYVDVLKTNSKGGHAKSGDDWLNSTEDRARLLMRARLSVDAKVTDELKAAMRVSTGNTTNPISTNQTLGNYGNRYQMLWDEAYLKYDGMNADRYPWLTLLGGRMPNPFVSTELVWSSNLSFEGVAATYRYNLRGSENLLDMSERDRTLFMTVGAFPLQEVELSKRDKWLYGAQVGAEFLQLNQSSLKIALGYYHFQNTTGVVNPIIEGKDFDFTAPPSMQKGNLLYNIRNSSDQDAQLWALAAKYHELNFNVTYDATTFAPIHVWLNADVVKNIGYKESEIERRAQNSQLERAGGWSEAAGATKPRTLGYQFKVTVGWPLVTEPRNWQVFALYRKLERDAVMDAFADSDFHLGGTDAKGWMVGGDYGVTQNAWVSLRWITSDSIDAVPLGIDTLQVDFNAKF